MQTFVTAFPSTPSVLSSGGPQASTTPTLQWSASAGATGYTVSVTDVTTGQVVVDAVSVTSTSYTLPNPLGAGDSYQWQIRAFDNAGDTSPATAPVSFTVSAHIAAPALTPLPTSLTNATPTLQWGAVAGAAGYNLYLLDTTTNTQTVISLPATTTAYPTGTLTGGHGYQWWVVAFDSANNPGSAAAAQAFTVPAAPTLQGPGGVVHAAPTFQWSAVPGAVGYVLAVLDVTGGQPHIALPPIQVNGTSYTPGTVLDTIKNIALRQVFYFFTGSGDAKFVVVCTCLAGEGTRMAPIFEASMKSFSLP